MYLKFGVEDKDTRNEIWFAIGFTEATCQFLGLDFTITSLTEGEHSEHSLHYKGLAFDMRTRDFTVEQLESVFNHVKQKLNPIGYDVVKEGDHIHVEYDPKGRNLYLRSV
jgi:hypothetical protein